MRKKIVFNSNNSEVRIAELLTVRQTRPGQLDAWTDSLCVRVRQGREGWFVMVKRGRK